MTDVQTILNRPHSAEFEEFWIGLQETKQLINEIGRKQEETAGQMKETDRLFKETREQFRENAEQWKKTERIVKKNSRHMGKLHNRFGELAEHLVKPGIVKRFNELGYHFDVNSPGGYLIYGEDGKTKAEIDLLLENGDTVMAVEVKATPKVKHVAEHIKQLEILRDHRRKRNDLRQVEGAIAGAVFGIEEKKAVLEAGFYVIVQSGDTMKIEVPEGFVPKRW